MNKKIICKIGTFAFVLSLFCGNVFANSDSASFSASRIVSLAPAGTEILFAVGAGDKVVAVDEMSNYPPEAQSLPKIGGFDGKTISIEKILSFEPDYVYITKGMHDFLIPTFEKYGIKYYLSEGLSVDDVKKDIKEIGAVAGNKEMTASAISAIEDAEFKAARMIKMDVALPFVYYEVWNGPYMSAGGNTFISDLIKKAGGYNIFTKLNDWPVVSEESIIAYNPAVILIPKSAGITAESVASRAGWENIDAVKNNKIIIIDDDIYSRPGPRIAQAISELSGLIQ